jgi:hypothetical protein
MTKALIRIVGVYDPYLRRADLGSARHRCGGADGSGQNSQMTSVALMLIRQSGIEENSHY